MEKVVEIFKRYRWGMLSGVLIGTSWIPLPPWALWFCLVPLWWYSTVEAKNWKQVFWAGWWAQFILTLIGFYWVAFVSHEYGFLPWPVAVLVVVFFAAVMHVYIALAPALAFYFSQKCRLGKGSMLLLCALFMSLGEIYWPSIFPWNMGYPLVPTNSPLVQWVDTIGVLGLSLGILLINSLATYLVILKRPVITASSLAAVLGLVLILYWGGVQKRLYWSETDAELKVLQVQANIGNAEKYYAERGLGYERYIAEEFINLTRQGLQQFPDSELVAWPETALTEYLNPHMQHRAVAQLYLNFVREMKRPFLVGAYSKDGPEVQGRKKEYNALFLHDAEGNLVQSPYHKTQLLIFGEYIPYGDKYEWLAKINPGGAGFGRGSGPTVFSIGDARIGVQICYESLNPWLSSALDEKGANLLFNMTNDSWFGPTSEPYQHMYMTLARAIELRRPLVRTTNTGISTAILASGEVFESGPLFQKWYGQRTISYRKSPERTIYSVYGYLLPYLIVFFVLVILGTGYYRARTLTS